MVVIRGLMVFVKGHMVAKKAITALIGSNKAGNLEMILAKV